MKNAVTAALSRLVGQEIWYVMAGPDHGPTIGLEIGERRERRPPLTNPRLSEELRRFEGAFGLFITCAWRFAVEEVILCGSLSRNETDGEIAGGVTQLVSRRIVRVDVDDSFLDFTLHATDGARLSVFCDEVDRYDQQDNYHMNLEDLILVVGPASAVRQEQRTFESRPPLRAL